MLRIIVPGVEGASTSPAFSSDGKKAAFLAMRTNGYEADKNEIWLLPDLGAAKLTAQRAFAATGVEGEWDRSPSSLCFSEDGEQLLVVAEDNATAKLYTLKADVQNTKEPRH